MKSAFKSIFKVIANLVEVERQFCLDLCLAESPNGLYVCSRKNGHQGMHIAIGDTDELLGMWLFACNGKETNEQLGWAIDILEMFVRNDVDHDCRGKDRRDLMCTRKGGHKGLHVAIGSDVLSAWEDNSAWA